METLLVDPQVMLTCDLTGGKDSRMIFALIQKARERLKGAVIAHFGLRSSKGERWAKDLAAAQTIASHFDLTLNQQVASRAALQPRSPEAIFRLWTNLNVGLYYPVYFPPTRTSGFHVHVHGGSGGKHRPVYNLDGIGGLVVRAHRGVALKEHLQIDAWLEQVGSTLDFMQKHTPGMDPWILHYREFRNRLHAGRSPQYSTTLTPLDGYEAELLSAVPGKAARSQLHFDIMESLFPGLMHFPYDDPAKGPSPDALKDLTVVPVSTVAAPGTAYISEEFIGDNKPLTGPTPFEQLQESFAAASTAQVRELLPVIFKNATTAMEAAAQKNAFGHASHGRDISRVLAAHFALSLA